MTIRMNVELTTKSRKQGDPPDLYSSNLRGRDPSIPPGSMDLLEVHGSRGLGWTLPGHVTADSAGPAPRGVAYLQRHSVQLHPRRNRMVPVGSHPDHHLVS